MTVLGLFIKESVSVGSSKTQINSTLIFAKWIYINEYEKGVCVGKRLPLTPRTYKHSIRTYNYLKNKETLSPG